MERMVDLARRAVAVPKSELRKKQKTVEERKRVYLDDRCFRACARSSP